MLEVYGLGKSIAQVLWGTKMKYDPEWILAALADLTEFTEANEMNRSHEAISRALEVVRLEVLDFKIVLEDAKKEQSFSDTEAD